MSEKVLIVLIALVNIFTEVIWCLIPLVWQKTFGGNLKQIISVVTGIVFCVIAWLTGFFVGQDIHTIIISVLLVILGANLAYDKLIQPIRNML